MKKAVCMTISVLLLFSSAFALTDLEVQVYNHNSFSDMTGASIIEGEPEAESIDGGTMYKYTVNGVEVYFAVDEDDKVAFVAVSADEADFSEFLSQCLSATYNCIGINSSSYWSQYFLEELAAAKAGKRQDKDSVDQEIRIIFMQKDGKYFYMTGK